ncbi:LolA-like outer membrane lipoprotein chaperone [Caminibacter pacificus]
MKKIILFLSAVFLFALTPPKEFSAKFVQTVKSQDRTITYKGDVYKKGEEIVWKYTYPTEKTIWIKNKIYIYEPDLMQLTIANKKNATLNEILKKAKKIKDDLYETKVDNKTIYFIYDKTLKKLYYTDDLGNKVEIKFFDQKNSAPSDVFKLNYPADVDVVHEN